MEGSAKRDPVFISGRFRSGSTLLWSLFRSHPQCTSFYEPFNERRWFDPSTRGDHTDASHRGVDDYWSEYEGVEGLAELYEEDWIRRDLLLDATCWRPRMQRFIGRLIAAAPETAVLQFNRVDFRLPWLRARFPGARIVHLYRHPRDEWWSTLHDERLRDPRLPLERFFDLEGYYLRDWAEDLKFTFPFLDTREVQHAYELFYYIWRLSWSFGERWSDVSVAFEDLMAEPTRVLHGLFEELRLDSSCTQDLARRVDPPARGRWRRYAHESWFVAIESRCEAVLADWLGLPSSRPAELVC